MIVIIINIIKGWEVKVGESSTEWMPNWWNEEKK